MFDYLEHVGGQKLSLDPQSDEFGSVLKRLRLNHGLTQPKLAESAGCDHSYVSRLEGGHRHPTLDAVERLAEGMSAGDEERDQLRLAAGYVPSWMQGSIEDQALHTRLSAMLRTDSLPRSARRDLVLAINEALSLAEALIADLRLLGPNQAVAD